MWPSRESSPPSADMMLVTFCSALLTLSRLPPTMGAAAGGCEVCDGWLEWETEDAAEPRRLRRAAVPPEAECRLLRREAPGVPGTVPTSPPRPPPAPCCPAPAAEPGGKVMATGPLVMETALRRLW